MEQSVGSARVARLDDKDAISVAGGLYLPLRRLLGVRAFGINGYTARAAGEQLIEQHDETGAGSGHQEEAYIVVFGHALFTINAEEIDAPAGTIVFVPDITATRSAIATLPNTTAIVVGGPANRPLPISPFEYWYVAEAPYRQGDYQRAIDITTEGLEQWPHHPTIHYQLACYHSLAGHNDHALEHLAEAVAADANVRTWASTDSDLDPIRSDARFVSITSQNG